MSTRSHRSRPAESQPAGAAATAAPVAASAAAVTEKRAAQAEAATAKRSHSKAKAAAAEPMEHDAEDSGATTAVSSVAVASSFSVSALLGGLGGASAPPEETAAAAQLRTLQHAILKQANTRAADLMHPQLWPAFLARMEALPANTVRIDVHVLSAISRTLAEGIAQTRSERAEEAATAFTLLPTLQRLLQLLLPADNASAGVSVSESWASTFHPNYELISAFIGGLLRMVPTADAVAPAVQMADLPPSVWRFLSTALAAFALINAQQTSQRKVYEHALQERNLPVWASVHQAIQTHVQRVVRQETHLQNRRLTAEQHARSESMRECATKLEQCITGVLFHAEHLGLYADALGFKNTTAKEESDEDEEKKEAPAADDGENAAETADEPAGKKAKTEPTDAKSASRKKGAVAAAGAAHKPHPNNFTHKLFEAVQTWIARDQSAAAPAAAAQPASAATAAAADAKTAGKKRKTAAADDAAPAAAASAPSAAAASAVPVSSSAIRALLPLLFSGFVSSSETAHLALYPAESSSHELSPLESRRKKVKEALKSERELKFLQRMWAINEGSTGTASATSPDSLVSPVFSAPLTSASQLATLHAMFTTSAALFRLIASHQIYKINQDANAASGSFTGFKKYLTNQVHAIMAVVRNLIVAAQAAGGAAAGAKASKKSASSSKSASGALSKLDLLSLAVPLATNLHHLLSLNPEFLSRYLYVRSTKSSAASSSASSSTAAVMEVNVWHLVWKVAQLSSDLSSSSLSSSLPSPPGLALPTVRQLSQSILASYSKSRSMETLFNSYVSAARTAAILDPSLPIQPFATMCGPAFDTSSLMRSVPVLKVPSLWEWFLTQADRELTAEADASSPETQQALLHFFVYFLDTLLVREEIAVQLQALIGKTMEAIIAQPLRTLLQQHLNDSANGATKPTKSKGKKKASTEDSMNDVPASSASASASKLPLSCLLLLLHSLNDLTAQCAQHLEKTYETMLQPLVGYFHAIDTAAAASADASGSTSSTQEMRLTEVISSLSSSSSSDASLLYSLHLLAIQRLHQLFRFESRNITTHSGLLEASTADSDDEDADDGMDSDGDVKLSSKSKKANGTSNGGSKRAPQSHSQEAQALTAFLLEHQASCRYDASSSASLDRYSWDGSASSLVNDNAPRASTALWFLLAGNLDVVAHFASPLQRQALVQNVVAISAYTHCDAAAAEEGAVAAGPAASASLHTLRSITLVLYTQPWLYEVAVLRPVLMDVALSNLLTTAGAMMKAADKAVRKAAAAAPSATVAAAIPAEFTLTTAAADQLPALRQFAEYTANVAAAASSSSSSSVSAQSLWDSIWLLQLLHTFPAQYFASSPQFHAIVVQITWSIESLASHLSAAGANKLAEPLSLLEIARAWQTVDAASLYSHLILASRRMLLSSLNALAISPAASSSALLVSLVSAPLLEWSCFGTFRRGGLLGRHVAFAREATRTALHLITPALMLAGKHKIKADDSAASSSEDKKASKSSKAADKSEKVAPISVLQPVVERISTTLNGVSGSSTASDRADAVWCLQLASSLVDSFVPGWSAPLHGGSSSASIDALAKSFRTLSRDAPLVFDLLSQLNRAATKKLLPLLSSATASSDDSLLGGTFDLSARLLVNLFAYRMSFTSKEKAVATPAAAAAMDAKMDDKLLGKAEGILAAALKLLSEQDGVASTSARQGAITLVHALCVILPLFQADAKAPITFAALLDAVTRAMACDAGKRLNAPEGAAPSAVTNSILAAFASLQSHATPADSAQMVNSCLAQLDPSFAHADAAMSDEASAPSMYARHSGALQLLYVYIYHMQTSAQRQAVSHAHVSLLLYRLGALSADWSNEYLSRSAASASCVSLATSSLTLLSHILSRHQVFVLDDASLSLLAQLLNNVAVMLRDSVAKRSPTDAPAASTTLSFSLYTPFYLALYSLLKFHPASTIKLVHLFLGCWVRALLEAHWKKIQHSDPAVELVPLSISENAARLLEEVGKPSHSKLFNHYAVGTLLEWINLSKTKGVGWGSSQQDKHVKTIHRGIYAIIHICEEHDLAQLHNLLDASGRTIFRSLHQAYKKTKFTGLV